MKSATIMKLAACAFMAMTVLSCSKSKTSTPTPTPTPTPTTATFTFKVDGGTAITVDSANAVLYTVTGKRYMDVYAYKGGAEIMEFHFDPQTGAQTVGNALGAALLTYMESPTSSYDSQSGAFSLTTCDTVGNKLEGDFNFVGKVYPYTGTATHTISEGHMVVTKLTKQ